MEVANRISLCFKVRNINYHTAPLPLPSNSSRNMISISKNNKISDLISSHTKTLGIHNVNKQKLKSSVSSFKINQTRNCCHYSTWPHGVSVEEWFRADSQTSQWPRFRPSLVPKYSSLQFRQIFSHFLHITMSVYGYPQNRPHVDLKPIL